MATKYEFFVDGKPHGKDRPRLCMQKGRDGKLHPVVYTPAETRQYEECTWRAFLAQCSDYHTLRGPVALEVIAIYVPAKDDPAALEKMAESRPAYNAAGRRTSKDGRIADLDNVIKIIGDGIQGKAAAIVDDTQVVQVSGRSIYGPRQGVKVVIKALSEE